MQVSQYVVVGKLADLNAGVASAMEEVAIVCLVSYCNVFGELANPAMMLEQLHKKIQIWGVKATSPRF